MRRVRNSAISPIVRRQEQLQKRLLLLLLLLYAAHGVTRSKTVRERQHRHRVLEQDLHGWGRHPEFGHPPGRTGWTSLQPVLHCLWLAATLRASWIRSVVYNLMVGRELSTVSTLQLRKQD